MKKNSLFPVGEPVNLAESDQSDEGKTLKKIKKKTPPLENDDGEGTLIRKKDAQMKLIHNGTQKEFSITKNVEVKRRKKTDKVEILLDSKTLVINDEKISRNQCEFKPFQKGYTIADKGSSNGTYIMIKKEYETLVYDGMVVELGDFFLKIIKATTKLIKWKIYQDDENEDDIENKISSFKNNHKIQFGRKPGSKNAIEINDKSLEDVLGYFEKNDFGIYIKVLNETKP